jgi:hypothetical protein
MTTEKKEGTNVPAQVTLEIPNLAQLGKLKGLKEVYKATAGYRTQEEWFNYKDKPVRCFFLGIKELPSEEGDSVNCGIFAAETGIFLAAQHVLIESVRTLEKNTPIEITFKGKKKNKKGEGSTNLFEVVILG